MTQPTHYAPHPELNSYIAGYGMLEIPEGRTEPYFSPPLGLSGIILQTLHPPNSVIARIEDRNFFTDSAVVTGQVTSPVYGQLVGHVKSILIFLKPLGMYQLFGTDMATLTNKSMKLPDLLGVKEAYGLMTRLKARQDNEHQIKVLNDFFRAVKPFKTEVGALADVLSLIHEKKGNVSIHEMEIHGYYHRKTLERHFNKMVGLSPKVYVQIYRFKCLINLLQDNPDITWVQLAGQAGYYDQSHMARYIREYLKVSPNSIVQLDMDFINYLLRR